MSAVRVWALIRISLLPLTLGFSLFSLKYLPLPYVWISGSLTACFLYLAVGVQHAGVRRLYLSLAAVWLSLGTVETLAFAARSSAVAPDPEYRPSGYLLSDDVLGYAPAKGAAFTGSERAGSTVVYSTTYTIDSKGLRIGPAGRSGNQNCALFFGDSFTFGEGVRDDETMPYVVGERSGVRTLNFAFHGYGPHQMLAQIQSGLVRAAADCTPSAIVYQALVNHAMRAAGHASWDTHGPRYVRTSLGVVRDGRFDDRPDGHWMPERALALLNRSFVYRRYALRPPAISDADVDLFVEIVDASRKALHAMYPSATFSVILWNPERHGAAYEREVEGLRSRGIDLRLAGDILPGYDRDATPYILHPLDRHPNAATQRLIAEYVVRQILPAERRASH